MSEFRKLIDLINESSASCTSAGGVAPVAQPMTTQERVEEDGPKSPEVIEYGNWENSALATTSKLKKNRDKSAKVVKSIYGEEIQAEAANPKQQAAIAIAKKKEVAEGKFTINAKTGAKLDPRTGAELPPKEKPLTMKDMFRQPKSTAPKLTLDDVWRKVEDVVGRIFPDGDPIDHLAPWLEQHGIRDFKIGEILDRAAKKNGYKDLYDYYDSMKDQYARDNVAEAGHQSPHTKLAQLKAKYDAALKSPNPNMTTLRRIRDQIIKLEFDLGLKEGVAEGYDQVPTDIDEITKMLNDVLAHEEDYPVGYKYWLVRALEKAEEKSQGVAEGSLNEGQYEMMLRNGQVKKFVAKDDADAKRIAKGHGAKSVIRLKGGVPAGKVSEQGVDEGMLDTVKSVGKKVLDKLAPDDEALIKDLQKKVGVPQTGKKPAATHNDEKLDEQDLILNPSSMGKLAPGLVAKAQHPDHELEMAKSDLYQTSKNALAIFNLIKDRSEMEGLEGWVQEKITKAEDYLNTVRQYLEGKQLESIDGVAPGTHMFTSEDELAEDVDEGKTGPGLWANIHAKRKRIKSGSGERMRKPGSEGAPKASDFKAARSDKK